MLICGKDLLSNAFMAALWAIAIALQLMLCIARRQKAAGRDKDHAPWQLMMVAVLKKTYVAP